MYTLSRDFIRETLELREGDDFTCLAQKRDGTLKVAGLIDHDDAWS